MKLIEKLFFNKENRKFILDNIKKNDRIKSSKEIEARVREIIEQVKKGGDQSLLELTRHLDKNNLRETELAVTQAEFKEAENKIDNGMFDIVKQSIGRVKAFHKSQYENSWFSHQEEGMILGQLVRPIERVGIYVPGGMAEYPSSLIMGAVPAIIAGVTEMSVVTPLGSRVQISPYLLMTAQELGITKIYKVGGAQAIAALAYGTETIQPVDKIVGPGNIYVTMAKKQVFGQVSIDMLAGPSEILIWAEDNANPDYVIADLLSQAEHDQDARAVLVTTSRQLAKQVELGINQQIEKYEKKDIIIHSLKKHGKVIVAENSKLVIELINEFAPEHLELQIDDPWAYLGEIKNFGAVFLGPYSPEPLGDYWAGPNHILPTMGSARQFSVLSVHDFLKRSSIIYCRRDKLLQDKEKIARFADMEGLSAHANALRIRK
ncbi:MAG: histidinol dehydrogenase [Elusimicrobiota bacterium]